MTPGNAARASGTAVRAPRAVARAAWAVVLVACLAGALAALGARGLTDRLTQGGWTPPRAESVRADALLAEHFRAGSPDLVLLATGTGSVDAPDAVRAGRAVVSRLASDPRTAWVRGYWPADGHRGAVLPELRGADGRRAAVLVRFRGDEQAVRAAARDAVDRFTGRTGPLRLSASGESAVRAETERLGTSGLRLAELVAVPLVLVLLLWAFGSLTAALLPVVVGVLAVTGTMAFLRLLTEVATVSVFALNITTALGFGLAVDFGLLMVSRFREELGGGAATVDAVRRAWRTAGAAVACSTAVVAGSLGALLVFPLPLLRSIAYGGVAVVVSSAVGALLVLPALLFLLGGRVNRYDVFARLRRPPAQVTAGAWYRLAQWVTRHPLRVAAGTLALLLAMAFPLTQARFGMYDDRVLPRSSPVARASQELRSQFTSEAADAATVVLPAFDAGRSGAALDSYARRLSLVPDVRRVSTATGHYAHGRRLSAPTGAGRDAGATDRGAGAPGRDAGTAGREIGAAGRFTGPAGTWLSVAIALDAPLSPEGIRLTERLRAVAAPAPVLIGGPAARLADTRRALADRLPLAALLVATTSFLLLLGYTRSVLVPLKALLLNALGLAATFGFLVAVFQQGHLSALLGDVTATGITDVVVPSLMLCVAFGLSMDYEVFLLSRIVEEHRRGAATAAAVALGLQRTGRLFTSAALIFAAVMVCLAASSSLILLKLIGLGMALAVLLDCTVVRALLVPAVMRLLGRANWWLPRLRSRRAPGGEDTR
ncbi:MMPL family transporter [Streptomyces sp. URMC 123]|uniref:MMPL family transporter n=1 Tax=Streptomyces sp. URMC 123 TaxID=3423403 RepID=UPI003F1DBAE8